MHVLHRSHLGGAVAVTAIAAALAIVLTLAIASNLSDHALAPAPPAGPTGPGIGDPPGTQQHPLHTEPFHEPPERTGERTLGANHPVIDST